MVCDTQEVLIIEYLCFDAGNFLMFSTKVTRFLLQMQSDSADSTSIVTDDSIMESLFELGFDFSSDLFDSEESTETVALTKETPNDSKRQLQTAKVVKSCSSSTTMVSKGKRTVSQRPKGSKWLEKAEKKAAVAMLYAFPSFDRSDSLIFLPTSLCRLMNSGDIPAISKLIMSHFSKTCVIKMSYWDGPSIDVKFLLKMYKMLLEVHPDSIQVAHNTKVDGNKITAHIFAKHTDSRVIHNAVRRTTNDPVFTETMRKNRVEELHQFGSATTAEMERFEQIAASHDEDDLLVYFHLDVEYIIDDITKKVSQFNVTGKVTGLEPTNQVITSY